jgi:thioesterase domain-containing protein/acyl carrier protein
MVPSTIGSVTRIPLTPNGKVDHSSLPSPQAAERPETLEDPADEVEEKLLEIWTVELERERIGVNDNFFELGGDSLRAVKIIARVHDQFRVRPQLARLFTHPSIRALAKCIRELQDESKAEVIPIQESGSRSPLYWIAPSPLIRELSRELGPDQPVFGVAIWNWDKRLGDASFEWLCAEQAEAVKAHPPAGPVVLGGWCLEGLLAYDTACRCADAGVPVRAVVLFDTVAPSPPSTGRIPRLARRIRIIWNRFTYHLSRTFRTEPSHRLQYFTDRIRGAAHHVRKTVDTRHTRDRSEILAAAAQKYALPRASFPVIVVVPEDNLTTRVAGPFLGWSSIADGQLKRVTVPGDHRSMFQPPNLEIVAANLCEVLDTLDSE